MAAFLISIKYVREMYIPPLFRDYLYEFVERRGFPGYLPNSFGIMHVTVEVRRIAGEELCLFEVDAINDYDEGE